MRMLIALLALSGCVIAPPIQQAPARPIPQSCPAPPKPVWPDSCVEDWYARAELPPCVKDWVVDLTAQQKDIAKKRRR